jgi:proteasome lid subunit RPN8/RPN11
MTEQCWVLIGGYDEDQQVWRVRLRRHVSGRPATVEVDWKWALEREEEFGNLAGFAHTHPAGSGTNPSDRDNRTMQAWCIALGKPLLCIIGEGKELTKPTAYVYDDDHSNCKPTKAFEIIDS